MHHSRSDGEKTAFEPFEQRILLTRVFAFEPIEVEQAGFGSFEHSVVITDDDRIAQTSYSIFGGTFQTRFFIDGQQSPQIVEHDMVPQPLFFKQSASAESFAAAGLFRSDNGSPDLNGVGMFALGSSVPQAVLYADSKSPTAQAVSIGLLSQGSIFLKVSIEYSDDHQLQRQSVMQSALQLKGQGSVITGQLQGVEGHNGAANLLATYLFPLPTPTQDGTHVGQYTVNFAPGAGVQDFAGNVLDSGTLGSFFYPLSPENLPIWTQPDFEAQEPYPWNMVAYRGTGIVPHAINDTGWLAFSSKPAGATHTQLIAWTGSQFVVSAQALWNSSPIRLTDSGSMLVTKVSGGNTLIYFVESFTSPTQSVVAAEGTSPYMQEFRSIDMSGDGRVVIFQARRADTDTAGHAIYASSKNSSYGIWVRSLLVGGNQDGRLDLYETEFKVDAFDSPWGPVPASAGDSGIDVGKRMSLLSTVEQDGRFRVVFEADGDASGNAMTIRLVSGVVNPVTGVITPSMSEIVAQSYTEDAGGGILASLNEDAEPGVYVGAEKIESGRVLLGGEYTLRLLTRSINASGNLVFEVSGQNERWLVRARDGGLRPVLLLHGIFGSMPDQSSSAYVHWLMNRGAHPENLHIDPIAGFYDDLIATLEMAGYIRGETLLVATYDWRIPPAPIHETPTSDPHAPPQRVFDGIISGFTGNDLLADIQANEYASGVHYMAYWLEKAKQQWNLRHKDAPIPLDSVDVIAHSTGGLVARSYIQSEAYMQAGLLGVNRFQSIAVPHRGASKAWNILHDNFRSDIVYQVLVAGITYGAYQKVMNAGQVITGPYGTFISRQSLLDAVAANPAYRTTEEAFISMYAPTGRGLLATYPFIQSQGSAGFDDVNNLEWHRNALALDLNQGLDYSRSSSGWQVTGFGWTALPVGAIMASRSDVTVFYGTGIKTMNYVEQMVGPVREWGVVWIPNPLPLRPPIPTYQPTTTKSIFGMQTGWRPAGSDEIWYRDLSLEILPGESGDGTVPTQSSVDLFRNNWVNMRIHGFKDDHNGILSNDTSRQRMLAELGLPHLLSEVKETKADGPGLVSQAWSAGSWLWLINDPVESYVIDAQGRRMGWSEQEGALTEIPGSFYYGGADGFGGIVGEIEGPLRLHVRGIEHSHFVQVGGMLGGLPVHTTSEGSIGIGEQRLYEVKPQQIEEVDVVDAPFAEAAATAAYAVVQNGHAVLYLQRNSNEPWHRVSLTELMPVADGSVTEAIAVVDPTDATLRVVVLQGNTIVVYTLLENSAFMAQSLGDLNNAQDVERGLLAFHDAEAGGQAMYVAAITADGDILLHTLSDGQWEVRNLGDAVREVDQTMPELVQGYTAYVTPWGAINIVGLDTDGAIHTVWTAPSFAPHWRTDNLSQITGSPAYAGQLTVYITPWRGINIAGAVESGNIVVTWWVPSFGGEWVTSDFNELFGGPQLMPDSLASYVTAWGGLNLVGLNADGELVVYWWVSQWAGSEEDYWRVSPLSDASDDASLAGKLTSAFDRENTINIYGTDSAHNPIRYFFRPSNAGWMKENLFEIAQPFPAF